MKAVKPLFVFCLILYTSLVFSQPTDASELQRRLTAAINNIKTGVSSTIPIEEYNSIDKKQVLRILQTFKGDPSVDVRFAIQTLQFKIAMSADTSIRQIIVENLLEDFADPSALINQQAAKRLLGFQRRDFSLKSKGIIKNKLFDKNYDDEIILLAGVAGLKDQASFLSSVANNFDKTKSGWYASREWYSKLALARMGDRKEIEDVIKAVESETDDVFRVTRLLVDIAYIRQLEGIRLLRKYLESEKRLPRVKASDPGIQVSQYAISFLSQSLEGFPIVYKGVGYSEAEIRTAKEWMKEESRYRIKK